MNEDRDRNLSAANEKERPLSNLEMETGDSAESIKDAHATGIGSLGRNDEKLDEEDKSGEDAGIIKD
ncbi:MAG TPA: hypothetical protein VM935_04875 [Chitinophagaceae bacterium]|nr:hypothetical protein [Chitinophagaceae bacterium]